MNINNILKLANLLVKATASFCQVDLENYSKDLKKYLARLMDYSIDKKEEAKFISLESLLSELKVLNIDDEDLIKAIMNRNENKLYDLLLRTNLRKKIPYELSKNIRLYCDTSPPYSKEDLERDFDIIFNQTKKNMERICLLINERISNIENYQGTTWKIIPIISSSVSSIDKLDYSEPADSASVISNIDENVSFGLYQHENKLEVDDVIEDEVDIESTGWQSDYYNLINEVRNPGSSSKGKNITLYTARPTKDRGQYLSASTLPNGIYLTSNLSSAEGLAIDLAGSEDVRDIYRVRINTKYLLKTLDTPLEKQYRVLTSESAGAPAKIELL